MNEFTDEIDVLEYIRSRLLNILEGDKRTFHQQVIDDYHDRYFDGVYDAYKIVDECYMEYFKEK